MPFKDSKEGTTHYQNDGCGESAHNHLVLKLCASCNTMKNMYPNATDCKRCTCNVMIHTRGFRGMEGPITCGEKKPCKMHLQENFDQKLAKGIDRVLENDFKTQEGWEERFQNDCGTIILDDVHCGDMEYSKLAHWENIKDFIRSLLNSETILKGERRRIIEQIRDEEREKVAREIGEEIESMKEGGTHQKWIAYDQALNDARLRITQKYYSHKN